MSKFPRDVAQARVLKALKKLGFELVAKRTHIQMRRINDDGSTTPLTMPNHPRIKGSTLRLICTQAGIPRDAFLAALNPKSAKARLPE